MSNIAIVTTGAPAISGSANVLHLHNVCITDPQGIRMEKVGDLRIENCRFEPLNLPPVGKVFKNRKARRTEKARTRP